MIANGRGGTLMRRALLATTAMVSAAIGGVAGAQTLPTDGQVVVGTATIQSNATDMTVNTATQRTVIDWSSFSVASDHRLTFNQPDAASITVNRVTGADPSQIFGTIASNGRVVIANPNGIWFGPSSRVDVAGLVASAGRISDVGVSGFASGGALTIDAGNAGATVVNEGSITAYQGGFAALVAPAVRNAGTITARLGKVTLAAGRTATVDFYGDGLINLAVAGTVDSTPLPNAVANSGAIFAEGGQVRLSASVAEGLLNSVINMSGVIEARGVSTAGGVVELLAGTGSIDLAGRVDVGGTGVQQGGRIAIHAGDATAQDGVLNLTGTLNAESAAGLGGTIDAEARFTYLGGRVTADGADGGRVSIAAAGITQAGSVTANGMVGAGGSVALDAGLNVTQTFSALTSASGTGGAGGSVLVRSGADGRTFSSGTLTATGATGGMVQILGNAVTLAAATADASGTAGHGGAVLVGGDLHGTGLQTADATTINGAVTLRANGGANGDGGRVVVWSNSKTDYQGNAYARGGTLSGNGGMIEVSSGDLLNYGGGGDAAATNGKAGTLLLDPKNIVISETTGGLAVFDLYDPNIGVSTGFGTVTQELANGTLVITKPNDTVGGAANAGSVYYYNPQNGALLSTFQGSHASDRVGSNGLLLLDPITTLDPVLKTRVFDNSKAYLIRSNSWNGNRGALTWVAANGMASGVLSDANSLVGSTAGDLVGQQVDVLSTGNYVVRSSYWGDRRGAVTFGTAANGVSGEVSAANSMVGTLTATANADGRSGDAVGSGGLVKLDNGNFFILSPYWKKQSGALTFGNGLTGFAANGAVDATNSLVGDGGTTSSAVSTYYNNSLVYGFYGGDNVAASTGQLKLLTNGDVVLTTPAWGHGRGAVTYVSGSTGMVGTVSATNSLVGTTKGTGDTVDTNGDRYYTDIYGYRGWYGNDAVGSHGVTELANGGFVIRSPSWGTGRGAVTYFAPGTQSLTGTVSAASSLTGTTPGTASGYLSDHRQAINGGDQVGTNVVALANGNYVAASIFWGDLKGAVTVLDGTTGRTVVGSSGTRGETVSTSNSLVGSTAGDFIGSTVTPLTGTSDFVTASSDWQSGKGAVTRISGTTGLAGVASSSNSLVGTNSYEIQSLGADNVGSTVRALASGAFVILSPNWNKTRGAATFVAAGQSITGTISSSNSLVGSTGAEGNAVYCNSCSNGFAAIFGGDAVGNSGIIELANGNFLIRSSGWSSQRGAVTLVNGTTGALVDGTTSLTGTISATNSVVGTQAATRYVSSRNYVGNYVGVRYWVGGDHVGTGVQLLNNDRFLLQSTSWHNQTGAVTLGNGNGTFGFGGAFAGEVSATNSLVGSTASQILTPPDLTQADRYLDNAGDMVGSSAARQYSDGMIAILSPNWSAYRGAITFADGLTGTQGIVGATNSMVGSQANDRIGAVNNNTAIELADGTRLFAHNLWNAGAGAVTRIAAGTIFTGELNATNSLVGNASDRLGSGGFRPLAGGGLLILSPAARSSKGVITISDGIGSLTGTVDQRNSYYGVVANGGTASGMKLATPGTMLMSFRGAGSGTVTLGFNDPTGWTYARAASQTLTIAPSLIEKSLNAGTSLVLQANNDITINSAIAANAGATGNLTLEAGRSIIGNADIGLGAGSLTLLANNSVANGVVDAYRASGDAAITFANNTTITTTGTVGITLAASTDKTNNGAGAITLGSINAATVDVRNLGSANGALTLNGAIAATGNGTAILLATGGAFYNDGGRGAAALSATNGRFLVYSADPRNNRLDNLTADGKFYGRTLDANPPSSLSATDDLFLYSVVPQLTVTGNATVGYGDTLGSVTPAVTGFIDGDTAATAMSGAAALSSLYQAGDAVGGSYAVNVGLGTLASSLGYGFNLVNGTVTVTPKQLTLALTGSVAKEYDRLTTATLTSANYQLTGLYGSDSISVGKFAGGYASANVGTGLNVSVTLASGDFTAGTGTSLSNYVLPTGLASAAIGTITARPLSVSGLTAANRVYDGTTAATLSGGTLSGVISGDTVTLLRGSGAFTDRNAGLGKAVTITGFGLSGADATNYMLAGQPSGVTATISAATLTLAGVTAQNRDYDGTTAIVLNGGTLGGIIGGDAVALVRGTASVASKNAGTQAVTATGFGLNGTDAGNYVLSGQPTGLSVTIAPLAVSLSGVSAIGRAYDGTTAVGLTQGSVAGFVTGDTVALVQGSGTLADRHAGIGKAVTLGGFTLSGADAGNYALTGVPQNLTVDIAAKALSLTGVSAIDRTYDGTTTATLSGGALAGIVTGDTVGFTAGTGQFADRNVGSNKAITISGFALTGASAGDYVLSAQPAGLSASITPATLTLAGVTAQNRDYDGTTAIALNGGTLGGIIGGDLVALVRGSASVASKNVGTQAVTATGFGLNGTDAGNYVLSGQPNGLSVTIAPLAVSLSGVSAIGRAYDGTTAVGLTQGSVAGFVTGDTVALVQGSGTLADRHAGIGKAVTLGGFTLSGADAGNYALTGVPQNLTVDIAAKALSLTGVSAIDRTYDGTTTATLSGGALAGIVSGDTVGFTTGTGQFADRNVGSNKAITISGFALTGASASDYVLSAQPAGLSASITPATLTLAGVTAQNRDYDGTTAIALNGGTLGGIIGGDLVALVRGTASVASKNVGTQAVIATGFGLTGAQAGNYVLAGQPTGLSVTIAPLAVSLSGVSAIRRAYDGTTAVGLTQGSVAGFVTGDTVALVQGSGTLADRHAGIGKAVTLGGFTLSGADAGNYALTGVPQNLTVDIAAKALSLTGVSAIDRTYDGTNTATLSGGALAGIVSGDTVGFTAGTGQFADRNVGSNKAITISGFALTGASAGDYVLSAQPAGLSASITPATLTLAGVTAQNRDYDGTTAIALNGGTLGGIIGGDLVTLVRGTASVASKNAGTHAVTATGFGLNGTDAGNYVLSGQPTGLSVTIAPLAVSLSGVSAIGRAYDGTTAVGLTQGSVAGFVTGDTVALVQGSGTLADRHAGIGKAVTLGGFTLSGADAGNYALTGVPQNLTVDIAAKALSLTGVSAIDRTYDGSTTATLSGGALAGIVSGDTVGFTTGTGQFADRNVGSNKAITISGFALTGASAGDYVLSAQPAGLSASITPATLTLAGVTAQNRDYDGTTAIALNGGTLGGIIGGDLVTLVRGTASVASKNAGTHAVTATGFGLNGTDAGNYVLAGQPTGLSVTIAPLAVSLSGVSAIGRAYDGTTAVGLTQGSVAGFVTGDTVALVQGSGTLADRHAGIGKAVTLGGFTLSGADAGNYALTGVPQNLTVDIAAKALSLTGVSAIDRTYDGSTTATLSGGALAGIVSGDTVGFTTGTGQFADRNVGSNKAIAISGFALTGASAGDYVLSAQPAGLSASITPATLTLAGVTAQNRDYDGTTAIALNGGTLGGIIGGDLVTLVRGTASVASKNAGTQAVIATGFGLNGTDAGNYVLSGQPNGLSVTIAPARLSVQLAAATVSKTYDGTTTAPLSTVSYRITGTVAGEAISIGQTTGSFASANAGSSLPVSVTLSASDYLAGANTSLGNYQLPTGTVTGTGGTILPAALLVRADDKTKVAGDPLPPLTATISGIVGGDTAASLGLSPTLTTGATAQSPGGSYAIDASGGQLANYSVTYQGGTLLVTPAPVLAPLQALIATQPVQSVVTAPQTAVATSGEVKIVTGMATAFVPGFVPTPSGTGSATATLTGMDGSAASANAYANSFLSSIKLESRK